MRTLVERLIYRKWFYAFLSAVLWVDCWTDLADLVETGRMRDAISLAASLTAALLVTLIFVDLHWKWPPQGR
jgi:hypothetical protein